MWVKHIHEGTFISSSRSHCGGVLVSSWPLKVGTSPLNPLWLHTFKGHLTASTWLHVCTRARVPYCLVWIKRETYSHRLYMSTNTVGLTLFTVKYYSFTIFFPRSPFLYPSLSPTNSPLVSHPPLPPLLFILTHNSAFASPPLHLKLRRWGHLWAKCGPPQPSGFG